MAAPVTCRGADHAVMQVTVGRPYSGKTVRSWDLECVDKDGSVRSAKWVVATLLVEWFVIVYVGLVLLRLILSRRPPWGS